MSQLTVSATLAAIVASLQDQTGVNNRSELIDIANAADLNDAAMRADIVSRMNAVSTYASLGLTSASAWAAIIAAISGINTGKKWATGSATSSSANMSANMGSGSAATGLKSVTVTGLTFKPSVIVLFYPGTTAAFFTVYIAPEILPGGLTTSSNPTHVGVTAFSYDGTAQNSYGIRTVSSPGDVIVSNTGFVLPTRIGSVTHTCLAFE